MPRKLKTPCKGRRKSQCKTAKKRCLYASGTRRKYCRKSTNRSHK